MSSKFKEIYENPMRNLNNVTRYSGVFCMKPENDGYHTIDMMAMCMKISDMIESDQMNFSKSERIKIDRKDLIYRCYLHDMDESLMGDISRNIKYYNDEIYSSINKVVKDLMSRNFSKEVVSSIESSKDKNSLNGLIVKVSDTLQSSIKIYEECKLGNFHFKKIIEENLEFVKNLKPIIRSSSLYSKGPSLFSALAVIINIIEDFEIELEKEIVLLNNN